MFISLNRIKAGFFALEFNHLLGMFGFWLKLKSCMYSLNAYLVLVTFYCY